ncbi:uncharacterized protein LOC134697486 [Mytilus trossulus]|uniref:uncharacterized protein LOC134697486 n=1 Tax=Mytilus trossulus TaxID=6551 RepID=UPI00300451C1
MKILFINAQSFKTAFGLHDIVEKYNIEILCVNETFEKPNSPIHFKDWKVYSSPRKDKTGGGSAIFIKPTLNFVTIRKPEYELDSIEMVCIEVKDRSNKTFNIWVPYVPPEKPKLMEELCNVVKKEKLKNLILLDDLNAKSMEWNNPKENSHGKLLENCMTTSNLICTNDGQYTRRNSSSVIDIVLVSQEIYNSVSDCITLTHETVQSDHIAVYLNIQSEENVEIEEMEETWNLKKADWKKWKESTKEKFQHFIFDREEKVQDLYNRFEKEIMECMEESIPKIEKKKVLCT